MTPRPADAMGPALVLAAHGDRGEGPRNRWLAAHAQALRASGRFCVVIPGLLKGETTIEDALSAASRSGSAQVLVYPLFMSEGYFLARLRERVAAAGHSLKPRLLPPLGAHPRLPDLMLTRARAAVHGQELDPAASRLLVIAHGSKVAGANAEAAEAVRARLSHLGSFASVATAFLEEPPSIAAALADPAPPVVAVGYFAGEGMHADADVRAALGRTGARTVYTGAIGADPGIVPLLLDAAAGSPATAA